MLDKDQKIKHAKRLDREKLRIIIEEHLFKNPCIECLESNPVVLEFNHRDPALKLFNISGAPRLRISVKRLQAEIDKCDVLCANCHRKVTHMEYYPERYS